MVNYDDHNRIKNILKKSTSIAARLYLSIAIILSPIFLMNVANASTVGGWTIGGLVADGASSVLNASKTIVVNGANVVKTSTARITPTVGAVSKVLARGAAGYALSIAVEQLLGSVDWVLDPANNRITYKELSDPSQPNALFAHPTTPALSVTASEACQAFIQWQQTNQWASATFTITGSGTNYFCNFVFDTKDGRKGLTYPYNLSYRAATQPQEEEEKSLPLDVVAAQVITNADSHPDSDKKAGSQVATTTAAQDLLDNDSATQSDVENQLNTNARTNTAEGANEATGETKPNVADPTKTDLKLGFPAFCGWAPTICEAAQATINFPQTVANWWSKAVLSFTEAYAFAKTKVQSLEDYFKDEPTQREPQDFEIETPEFESEKITLEASNACPQQSVSFSVMGQSVQLDMPYQPVCDALNFFRPAVLVVGAIVSVYIVAGIRTKEDE